MNRERIEDVIHSLRLWNEAYPLEMFPKLKEADRAQIVKAFPGCIDRISADMGRHIARQMQLMADELEKALGEEGQ